MKILFVAHSAPFSISEGIRLQVIHLIRNLSPRHEIHFISFVENAYERSQAMEMAVYCKSFQLVDHVVPTRPIQRLWNILAQRHPFCVFQFASEKMSRVIGATVKEIQPDVAHLNYMPMAQYEGCLGGIPSVLFPPDCLSLLFSRNAKYEANIFRRIYQESQAAKMREFEREVGAFPSSIVVVSPVDAKIMRDRSTAAQVFVIANGVDTDYFYPQPAVEIENVLLFRGIMSFLPNHDAAMFFATRVMPLIWQTSPTTEFWIVGDRPMKSLRTVASRDLRIKILGYVPDIRAAMAKATVIVCPMRIGSGIKNKVLESFSMGKAVLATSMSLAGISAVGDKDLLVGNTAKELARQAVRLLADKALRRTLGMSARSLVKKEHRWREQTERFVEVYAAAIERARTKSARGADKEQFHDSGG